MPEKGAAMAEEYREKDRETVEEREKPEAQTEAEETGEYSEEEEYEQIEEREEHTHVCSLCHKVFTEERPAVLTVGGFGTPRYLCEECDDLFYTATKSTDPDEINRAIREIGETMTEANCDDDLTIETVNSLIAGAVDRREKIEAGIYDFSLDEVEESEEDELPEELSETEEDRRKDREDEERARRADNIWGWITLGVIAAAAIAFVLFRFVF